MIHIAAARQSDPSLTNQNLSRKLSNPFLDAAVYPEVACNCAFIGYSVWRREENGDANLSDKQVFVVRDGQAKFLEPRNDLVDHSPDGRSWGYSGSGAAQLAVAILMEIFGNWERVQPIYQRFMDCFVAKLPQNTNWTADGSDLMAMALAIEAEGMVNPAKSSASSAATTQSARSCRHRQRQSGSESNPGNSRRKEENVPFLRALQDFKIGNRLNIERLDFVYNYVYPPDHNRLLGVRQSQKERAAVEGKLIDEVPSDDCEAIPLESADRDSNACSAAQEEGSRSAQML